VADLQHHALATRKRQQLVGFGDRARKRLLDEHVHSCLEQFAHDRVVQLGRHCDRRRIDLAEKAAEVRPRFASDLARHVVRALGIGVDYREQLGALAR
jgi:hypothetical protein